MGTDRKKSYKKDTVNLEKTKSLLDDMHTKHDNDKLLEEILMETLETPRSKGARASAADEFDLSDILGEKKSGGLSGMKEKRAEEDKLVFEAEPEPDRPDEPVFAESEEPEAPADETAVGIVEAAETAAEAVDVVSEAAEQKDEGRLVFSRPEESEPEKPEASGITEENADAECILSEEEDEIALEQAFISSKKDDHIAPANLAELVEFSEEDRRVNAEISAAVAAAIAEKNSAAKKAEAASDGAAKKKKAKKKALEVKPLKPILSVANIVYTAVAFAAVTAAFLALPRDEVSQTEQRKLAEFPEFSVNSFLNGEYTNGITNYFNDNVPYRDDLKKVAAQIRNLYGISYNDAEIIGPMAVITDQDEPEPEITEPVQTTAPVETTSLPDTAKTAPQETTVTTVETTTAATTTQPVETTKNVNEIAAGVVTNGQVVTKLSDGHWWSISLYGGGNGKTYATALNRFKKELGDDVNVWSMPAPTSGEFYLPDSYSAYNASHSKSIEQINAQLVDVTPVDCVSALWQHVNENIYLRTDHHWQPLGAYYAAKAFVEAAGLPFADISTMERIDVEGYMGTMYGFTESANLLSDPEVFTYYKPTNKYTAYYYDTAYNYTGQFPFFLSMPVNGSYSTFMGADNKIVRIKTDAGTGRKLVVIKDSYGNAEIPFFFNSFDEVYVCDMRYLDLNAVQFIKFTEATDVLFTCCTFSAVGTNANGLNTILNNPTTEIVEGAGR